MIFKPLKVFGALALLGLMTGAHAASILLTPTIDVDGVFAGDLVSFDINADFSDIMTGNPPIVGTGGGGFDILYDPIALMFIEATRSGLGDGFFSRLPDGFVNLLWVTRSVPR